MKWIISILNGQIHGLYFNTYMICLSTIDITCFILCSELLILDELNIKRRYSNKLIKLLKFTKLKNVDGVTLFVVLEKSLVFLLLAINSPFSSDYQTDDEKVRGLYVMKLVRSFCRTSHENNGMSFWPYITNCFVCIDKVIHIDFLFYFNIELFPYFLKTSRVHRLLSVDCRLWILLACYWIMNSLLYAEHPRLLLLED